MASNLSPAEFNTLVRTFHQFDIDNSNSIDVSELATVMEHLGVSMSQQQIEELVEQVDKNRNGELEFEEFCQLICMWKDASKFRLFDGHGVESLAKKRIAAALKTKLLIPDSFFRCLYDTIIALTASLYFVMVLLADAWGDIDGFRPVAIVVTILFAMDVLVCAATCKLDGFVLIDTLSEAASLYLRQWCVADVLAAFPFDLALGSSTAGIVLRHLRLLKVLKIPYLWQHSGRVPVNAKYISFHFKVLPICLILLQFVLVVHGFAMGFIMIKEYGKTDSQIDPETGRYPYTAALYFVIYTVCTVGYGDIEIDGTLEKWYVCIVLFGTLLTNGFIIGKLVALMQKADIHQDRRSKLRETLAVLQHFELPRQLQDEVLQFQDHLLGHSLSASYASIVEGLPLEMQSNISLFVKLKLISNATQFRSVHYIVKVAIAETLTNSVVLPEQFIIIVGEPVDVMYFIAHGFMDVFGATRQHLMTLKSGDYFGEEMLLQVRPSTTSVKALAYSDLWGLGRDAFLPLLERFPRFRRLIREMCVAGGIDPANADPPRRPSVFCEAKSTDGDEGAVTADDAAVTMDEVTELKAESINTERRVSFAPPPEPSPTLSPGTQELLQRIQANRRQSTRRSSITPAVVYSSEQQLQRILQRLHSCTERVRRLQQRKAAAASQQAAAAAATA